MADPFLKPCPFCGAAAVFDEIEPKKFPGHALWTVACSDAAEKDVDDIDPIACVASGGMVTRFTRKAEAAAAWNNRVVIIDGVKNQ